MDNYYLLVIISLYLEQAGCVNRISQNIIARPGVNHPLRHT